MCGRRQGGALGASKADTVGRPHRAVGAIWQVAGKFLRCATLGAVDLPVVAHALEACCAGSGTGVHADCAGGVRPRAGGGGDTALKHAGADPGHGGHAPGRCGDCAAQMIATAGLKAYVCAQAVDMRKSIDGLAALVLSVFGVSATGCGKQGQARAIFYGQ